MVVLSSTETVLSSTNIGIAFFVKIGFEFGKILNDIRARQEASDLKPKVLLPESCLKENFFTKCWLCKLKQNYDAHLGYSINALNPAIIIFVVIYLSCIYRIFFERASFKNFTIIIYNSTVALTLNLLALLV